MGFDKDLAARQEARNLCAAAENARKLLAGFSQEKLDAESGCVKKRPRMGAFFAFYRLK